jgi:putative membrane protein
MSTPLPRSVVSTSSLRSRAGENVRALTAALSVVSVGLVFAAAGGAVPATVVPTVPALVAVIPHVNVVLSLAAIAAIVAGVRSIRRGEVDRHWRLMVAAFLLFLAFLVLYLYKVVVAGTAAFPGPDAVYRFVYLPTLAVHVLLAVATLPGLYYVLLIGLTRSPAAVRETPHRRVGRVAASLWLVSFLLGIAVYAMLYVVY